MISAFAPASISFRHAYAPSSTLARPSRATARQFVLLGVVAGAPTIAGAWLGGLVYSAVASVIFLAIAAGAIAQVVILIARQMSKERDLGRLAVSRPVLAGLVAGFAVMYATGLMV